METYRVVMEIEVEAESPLEAAKTIEGWIRESGEFQYYVQNEQTKEISSVDLSENDDDVVLPVKEYEPLISL